MSSGKIGQAIKYWLTQRQKTVLVLAIALFVLFWSAVCFWKYAFFLYNGIDLAYFSQVFWNMANGQFFQQSIHPHLTLGDHAELVMPLLLPLYALWQDPRMLLLLQQVALALCAWPLYRLAERRFQARQVTGIWGQAGPLLVALAWLANPAVAYIGLFEFHILPFALLPLFFALLEYDRGRFRPFLVWLVLAMLCREDVPLVVAAIGLLAWIEKKPWKWRLVPPLIAAAWFVGAMWLISRFAPDGSYKFLIYYSWLGDTPTEALLNLFRHPLQALGHMATLANLETVLGLLMPLMFIPLLAPAPLVLAVLPATQMFLGNSGGGELVIKTHYSTLFLPALFLAAIGGLAKLPKWLSRWLRVPSGQVTIASGFVLALGIGYAAFTLGPLPGLFRLACCRPEVAERAAEARQLVSRIPDNASAMASYALLPHLASRPQLYSLHYQFLGVGQFGAFPYDIADQARFMALDTEDLIALDAQAKGGAWTGQHYNGGFARLRQAAGASVVNLGHFQLFDTAQGRYRPVTLGPSPVGYPRRLRNGLTINHGEVRLINDLATGWPLLEVKTGWSGVRASDNEWQMRLQLIGRDERVVWERLYPFGNGLISARELTERPLASVIRAPLFGVSSGQYQARLLVKRQTAMAALDDLSSVDLRYGQWEIIAAVDLGTIRIGQ